MKILENALNWIIDLFSTPMLQEFIVLCFTLLSLSYVVLIYNNLVRLRANNQKAWSNIEVILKQRNNELEKLIKTCQQQMHYERTALVALVHARQDTQESHGKASIHLVNYQLKALAEQYPDLKNNQSFNYLVDRVSHLEETLADRRVFFNETVTLYNIRIKSVPDRWVAKLFGFKLESTLTFLKEKIQDIDRKKALK